jgi:hypothetical protein
MLLRCSCNPEDQQHRGKREQERGSLTMLHLRNQQQRQRE